jgi:hypothetical protein
MKYLIIETLSSGQGGSAEGLSAVESLRNVDDG